jgi:hypothetical protein
MLQSTTLLKAWMDISIHAADQNICRQYFFHVLDHQGCTTLHERGKLHYQLFFGDRFTVEVHI